MDKTIRFILQEMPTESIEWVELIRVGKFDHAVYGKFDIDEAVLREFKLNFDRKARRVDIAVDYFHESYAEAAGWIKEVELRDNDTKLWIKVEWTEKASEKIIGKEIRYISADFHLDYVDSETKTEYGATLYGAGLTNRPHVKDMQPIFSDEITEKPHHKSIKEKTMIDFKDILESVGELSEDEKLQLGEKLGFNVKASEVEAKPTEDEKPKALAEKKTSSETSEMAKLSEEVKTLKLTLADKEKENAFNKMFSEGRVVEAQRDAYIKGDMVKFAENAVSVNFSGVGTSESSEDDEVTAAEKKLNELTDLKAKDEGISLSEAYRKVCEENRALAKKLSA